MTQARVCGPPSACTTNECISHRQCFYHKAPGHAEQTGEVWDKIKLNKQRKADLISDAHKKAMDAVIGAIDEQLCKDCRPLGMHSRVGDPIFLCYCGWGVDDELISLFVKGGCSLHLHCIVTCIRAHDHVRCESGRLWGVLALDGMRWHCIAYGMALAWHCIFTA